MADELDPEYQADADAQEKEKVAFDLKLATQVLQERMYAYRRVFVSGAASPEDMKLVLDDLKRFCRHGESTFHDNERVHVLLTGRQEVVLRIDDFTTKELDALVDKYTTSRSY